MSIWSIHLLECRAMSPPTSLFTLEEAASGLGCNPRWLADQLRDRRFPGRKVGRKWMLSADDIDEIVRLCAVGCESRAADVSTNPLLPQFTSMTSTTARRLQRTRSRGTGGHV